MGLRNIIGQWGQFLHDDPVTEGGYLTYDETTPITLSRDDYYIGITTGCYYSAEVSMTFEASYLNQSQIRFRLLPVKKLVTNPTNYYIRFIMITAPK